MNASQKLPHRKGESRKARAGMRMQSVAARPKKNPDAALLKACAAFMAAYEAGYALDATKTATDKDYAKVDGQWHWAFDKITALQPKTLAGRKARASVAYTALRWKLMPMAGETLEQQADAYELFALQCLADAAKEPPELHVTPQVLDHFTRHVAARAAADKHGEEASRMRDDLVAKYGDIPRGSSADAHWGHDPNCSKLGALNDESDRLGSIEGDLLEALIKTPSRTMADVALKITAVHKQWQYDAGYIEQHGDYHETFALAFFNDAAAICAEFVCEPWTAPSAIAPATDADANLLAACAEFQQAEAVVKADSGGQVSETQLALTCLADVAGRAGA